MIKRTAIVITKRDYHFASAKMTVGNYVVQPPVYDTM